MIRGHLIENHLIENLAAMRRHIDLCCWTTSATILPTKNLKLKTVAGYFGIVNTAPGVDGRAAATRMRAYRRTSDPAVRDRIRDELIRYVRSDVTLLVDTADQLRAMHDGMSPAGQHAPLVADDILYLDEKPVGAIRPYLPDNGSLSGR